MSGLSIMGKYVKEFCEFAKAYPKKRFFVTPICCGIAGLAKYEMAAPFPFISYIVIEISYKFP
jgi:hypothetical protein